MFAGPQPRSGRSIQARAWTENAVSRPVSVARLDSWLTGDVVVPLGSAGSTSAQAASTATTIAPSAIARRMATRAHHSVATTAIAGNSQATRSPPSEMPDVRITIVAMRRVVASGRISAAAKATAITAEANTGLPTVPPRSDRSGITSATASGASFQAMVAAATPSPVQTIQPPIRSIRSRSSPAPATTSTAQQANIAKPVRGRSYPVSDRSGSTPAADVTAVAPSQAPAAHARRRSMGGAPIQTRSVPSVRSTSFGSANGEEVNGVKARGTVTTTRKRPASSAWGRLGSMGA